jgi:hypothetical protein
MNSRWDNVVGTRGKGGVLAHMHQNKRERRKENGPRRVYDMREGVKCAHDIGCSGINTSGFIPAWRLRSERLVEENKQDGS